MADTRAALSYCFTAQHLYDGHYVLLGAGSGHQALLDPLGMVSALAENLSFTLTHAMVYLRLPRYTEAGLASALRWAVQM